MPVWSLFVIYVTQQNVKEMAFPRNTELFIGMRKLLILLHKGLKLT